MSCVLFRCVLPKPRAVCGAETALIHFASFRCLDSPVPATFSDVVDLNQQLRHGSLSAFAHGHAGIFLYLWLKISASPFPSCFSASTFLNFVVLPFVSECLQRSTTSQVSCSRLTLLGSSQTRCKLDNIHCWDGRTQDRCDEQSRAGQIGEQEHGSVV